MRIALTIFLYTIIFAFLGALLLGFAFQLITPELIVPLIYVAIDNLNVRIALGTAGFLLILISLATAQLVTGKIQREKTIAFSNPNGQVTVTLSAVEDLIKRLAQQLPEIKDARADVRARKNGIHIRMRLIMCTETNIPDFTAKVQALVASKIQEVFGIDEPITVKIHVAKILSVEEKHKKKSNQEPPKETAIPYQGIRKF